MMRAVKLISFLTAILFAASAFAESPFEVRDGKFWKNGKEVYLIGGEMHYPRIPREYWRHRIRMAKAMGINTLSTYVFWNVHEPEPGKWDFSGMNDVAEFIRIAGEEGLMVLLRPGPYVCAEWDFGGLPWWLRTIEGLELRQDNDAYLQRVRMYLERLYVEVKDLLATNGGPIVMVQCENEFGSFYLQCPEIPSDSHHSYMSKLREMMMEIGYDVPMYTADGAKKIGGGKVSGALTCVDGEKVPEKVREAIDLYSPGGPYFISEFYPGWLAHWAEKFPAVDADVTAAYVKRYIEDGIHFSFFMVHGGTNFGFWNGANYNSRKDLQPDLTSYDYDAPINEAGQPTDKYYILRETISKSLGKNLPAPPEANPVIEIPEIRLDSSCDVIEHLKTMKPLVADRPLDFEELGQGYGYILYSRHFNQPENGTLSIPGLHDYATVYIDGEFAGTLNRIENKYDMEIDIPIGSTLDILVENMGRINFGEKILDDRKGITGDVSIDGSEVLGGWEMRGLPMSELPDESTSWAFTRGAQKKDCPTVYAASFKLKKTGDTFLDMSGAGKGIVFVNGHNLGRYWNIGPQQTLYVPGVWLKKGKNEIRVFEQLNHNTIKRIRAVSEPVLKKLKTDHQ